MDTQAVLEKKDAYRMAWVEPWPAVAENGKDTDAHITTSASVQDCINMARRMHLAKRPLASMPTDEELLDEFQVVHWATPVPVKDEELVKRARRFWSQLAPHCKDREQAQILHDLLVAYDNSR